MLKKILSLLCVAALFECSVSSMEEVDKDKYLWLDPKEVRGCLLEKQYHSSNTEIVVKEYSSPEEETVERLMSKALQTPPYDLKNNEHSLIIISKQENPIVAIFRANDNGTLGSPQIYKMGN